MRFELGEVAKLIGGAPHGPALGLMGTEVTVMAIGPLKGQWIDGKPWYCDYYVRSHKTGITYYVYEKWLEKRIDPSDYIHHALKRAWSCGYNAGVRTKARK